MAITILENGWVSDSFVMGEDPLIYSDAIVMPKEEYDLLTIEQLDEMRQIRYNMWLVDITNKPKIEDLERIYNGQ